MCQVDRAERDQEATRRPSPGHRGDGGPTYIPSGVTSHRSFVRDSRPGDRAGVILGHLSDQFIYSSETSEVCFRPPAMRIGDVGLPLAAMGEPSKDENLANETGKAPVQLAGLPPLEAQNQADVAALRQGATDALRPEGGDVDSHALRKKTLCMNAWAPARHREQSCRPYPGKTPCPKEVLCHYAAIDVALANDKH